MNKEIADLARQELEARIVAASHRQKVIEAKRAVAEVEKVYQEYFTIWSRAGMELAAAIEESLGVVS